MGICVHGVAAEPEEEERRCADQRKADRLRVYHLAQEICYVPGVPYGVSNGAQAPYAVYDGIYLPMCAQAKQDSSRIPASLHCSIQG